ncbi:hypothetical protein FA13DRAFT_1696747 [Coprinellus micaceus]|uniref:CHAT domain-containing protein n=1 Tax=Coprinellus micaceus TaxID=71717 RepID=A0A4Y7SFJ6_COPMI|nr:hypothetical protein FA13DRAFT_1696747 [Coprinellus micaceus]
MGLSEKISLEIETAAHLRLSNDWDRLLARIRAMPGFESFLRPSPCTALLKYLPDSGPIVLINVDEHRCDALALRVGHENPLHIPLPNFSLKVAKDYHSRLTKRLVAHDLRAPGGSGDSGEIALEPERGGGLYGRKRVVDRSATHEILRGLWVCVVKPILDCLNFEKVDPASEMPPPRVWWCPTGPLMFLPIHAAGVYEGAETECTLDYVVSSYTPSLGALASRLANNRPIDEGISGIFLTSQPKAPGTVTISGTTEEVNSIHAMGLAAGVRVSKLEGDSLTVDGCLQNMEEFSSLHLACHAFQHAEDPLRSRFRFHNGFLELDQIIQRNLKNADLAFLSACQTSAGHKSLSDEAVHLAAGMLAAGYRRVVATMWTISDRYAPAVAKDFYQYLWSHRKEGSGSGFDGSLSAQALHHSLQQLRERLDDSEQSLLTWAAYVHYCY